MFFEKVFLLGSVLGVAGLSTGASAAVISPTIAQYNFDSPGAVDNGSGGYKSTVADNSGNGFDLTFNYLGTSVTDTPFGVSIPAGNRSFSTTNTDNGKLSSLAMNFNNGGVNSFTLEGWIKPATNAARYIAQLSGNAGILYLGMDSNGYAYADVYDKTSHYKTALTTTIKLDNWNYLAATYDGSTGTLRCYIFNKDTNNILTEIGTGVTTAKKNLSTTLNGTPTIATGKSVQYDDIRFSNIVLSDSQLGYHASFTQVPEPGSLSLLALGGLLLIRRRRGGATAV